MATMDIFNGSAFNTTALTGQINRVDYKPGFLGSLGLFRAMPVRTRTILVEMRDGRLQLIPTSAIGAPPKELSPDDRSAVPLKTTRLAEGFTLYAEEVQGVRAFGSESETIQVQAEYLRRMARVREDMELTHEHHRMGALMGTLLDADGTTVIYDFYEEFGLTRPAVIQWNLDSESFNIRGAAAALVRDMSTKSRGAINQSTTVHALAGDEFYDKLVSHPKVERTYLNYQAAAELRGNGNPYGTFQFGGVTWHNYRGTDDGTTISVPADQARFFPVGATDVFVKAQAPAEFMPYVNTPGLDTYAMNIRDLQRDAWVRGDPGGGRTGSPAADREGLMASLRAQIEELIAKLEPRVREAFEAAVADLRNGVQMRLLVERLERQDIEGAIEAQNLDPGAYTQFRQALNQAFTEGGVLQSANIPQPPGGRVVFRFDVADPKAEQVLREVAADRVVGLVDADRQTARAAILSGFQQGQHPNRIALDLAGRVGKGQNQRSGGIIGLSEPQAGHVASMRARLLSGDPDEMRKVLEMTRRDKAVRPGHPEGNR
ncbi:major capsid protein [Falsirhodobacter xinxiangensis]|uniref:major capsid protein n=1 Tax=Falsirhodobacter xinxiangensis TaxID=2530049 RepID=UPI0010AAD34D|nr:major capsid protein [Rhodobacter xinxiangensis]